MSISDTTEAAILALVFNATTWANYAQNAATTPETNIVVALHTAPLADTAAQNTTEIAYTNYARVNVPRTSGGWSITGTSPTVASPVANIDFPAGTGGTGTATDFSTGKSGGGASAVLWTGAISPSIVTGSGVTPRLTTATTCSLD